MSNMFNINSELQGISIKLSCARTALDYLEDDYFSYSENALNGMEKNELLYRHEVAASLVKIIEDYTSDAAELIEKLKTWTEKEMEAAPL